MLQKDKKTVKAVSKDISLENKIEYATQTLERNIGFINTCDTKASIILATVGVLITIFFTSDVLTKSVSIVKAVCKEKGCFNILYLIFLVISILILLLGLKNLISVLIGRVDNISDECKDLKYGSRIFFAGIVNSGKISTYRTKFLKMTDEEYLDEIINQIYINSNKFSL